MRQEWSEQKVGPWSAWSKWDKSGLNRRLALDQHGQNETRVVWTEGWPLISMVKMRQEWSEQKVGPWSAWSKWDKSGLNRRLALDQHGQNETRVVWTEGWPLISMVKMRQEWSEQKVGPWSAWSKWDKSGLNRRLALDQHGQNETRVVWTEGWPLIRGLFTWQHERKGLWKSDAERGWSLGRRSHCSRILWVESSCNSGL